MSQPLVGEIRMFAGNFAPSGWAFCNGQQVAIADFPALFAAIGTVHGGDGTRTFNLPDMRGRVPLHRGAAFAVGQTGGSELADVSAEHMPAHAHTSSGDSAVAAVASGTKVTIVADPKPIATFASDGFVSASGADNAHDNMQPFLSLHFIIALGTEGDPVYSDDPFIGEVRIFAGRSVPTGWKRCDGQTLNIQDHSGLFAAVGTIYGGDGRDTFSLPDLRARVALHAGLGNGLTLRRLGERGGSADAALSASQLPYHTHQAVSAGVSSTLLVSESTSRPAWSLTSQGVDPASDTASHNNMQPYLVLQYLIATRGVASA